jgi:hypothetical protein
MQRYAPQTPPRDADADLELAKSRLRVAAVQAGPAEFIRRHPLSTFVGTLSGAFALAAMLAGRKTVQHERGCDKQKLEGGFKLPAGITQWAMGLGMQMLQTQLNKRAMEKGAAADDKAEANAGANANAQPHPASTADPRRQEPAHAVG